MIFFLLPSIIEFVPKKVEPMVSHFQRIVSDHWVNCHGDRTGIQVYKCLNASTKLSNMFFQLITASAFDFACDWYITEQAVRALYIS